jgi:hypothetical protein
MATIINNSKTTIVLIIGGQQGYYVQRNCVEAAPLPAERSFAARPNMEYNSRSGGFGRSSR